MHLLPLLDRLFVLIRKHRENPVFFTCNTSLYRASQVPAYHMARVSKNKTTGVNVQRRPMYPYCNSMEPIRVFNLWVPLSLFRPRTHRTKGLQLEDSTPDTKTNERGPFFSVQQYMCQHNQHLTRDNKNNKNNNQEIFTRSRLHCYIASAPAATAPTKK